MTVLQRISNTLTTRPVLALFAFSTLIYIQTLMHPLVFDAQKMMIEDPTLASLSNRLVNGRPIFTWNGTVPSQDCGAWPGRTLSISRASPA